ncbi:MAG TPA: maleylpyruvate isomerase family mycothiol-dependent enzyme [Segeticoccus sp.]|uniref:maleylpyruvate isomerase family mycothiol-dependent enzyme n=1 Tax=Segeticoccus sp. TaxID=2706531 RepID=UPI002D7F5076|nr:maleylpyruvate isomerase family mycothiol-dependent enzyme [Segeticoccus sp.]HET8602056.1 maleylpyruvate isomerase family mycothiol-dependent enzyme [Segeticoccus sp.]
MPMHPAAPEDLTGLVEAFAQCAQAIVDLGHTCREEDFDRPTDCPGWTVKDQISHVVGVEAAMEGRRDPEVALDRHAHVHGEVGRQNEYAVQARRRRSGGDVVSELEHVLAQRLGTLRTPGLTESSILVGPMGQAMEAAELLRERIRDIWAHEQDIRTALERPGDLDSAAATVFADYVLEAVPELLGKVGFDAGTTVIVDMTGPIVGRAGVRIGADEHGEPCAYAMFTGEPVAEGEAGAEEAEPGSMTTISLSTDALTRRAAGRRSVEDTVYHVVGDEDVARRALEALVLTS